MPGALRPESVGTRARDAHRHGRRRVPHHLRSTRPGHRRGELGRGPWPARRPVPEDRHPDGQREDRGARVHRVPPSALAQIWSTNPLERVNKEIKRRARVVGIFPNEPAVIRLVGAILADMHDEWQSGEGRYLSEGSMAQLNPTSDTDTTARSTAAGRHRRSTLRPHDSAGHCQRRPSMPRPGT